MLNDVKRRELLARAHALPATVRLGAKGLTEAVIAEAEITIEHHELIKARISAGDREQRQQMAQELAAALKAELLKLIGHVAILYRRSSKPEATDPQKPSKRKPTDRRREGTTPGRNAGANPGRNRR